MYKHRGWKTTENLTVLPERFIGTRGDTYKYVYIYVPNSISNIRTPSENDVIFYSAYKFISVSENNIMMN